MSRKSLMFGLALLGILVVIAAASAAAMVLKPGSTAQAAPPAAPAAEEPVMDPLAPDTWYWRSCTITEIFVNAERAHVKCSAASPAGVYYYAMNGNGATQIYVNRALAILNTAYAMNKAVWITYDSETSANPPGCQTADCRALVQIVIQP